MNRHKQLRHSSSIAMVAAVLVFCGRAWCGQANNAQAPILDQRLQTLTAEFPGKAGIFVRNVETGVEVSVHADEMFPMASTYKVAIMTQVFREVDAGRMSLDERVTLSESDRRAGSGLFVMMKPGLNPTIHDLLLLMITVSDNEATDLLLKRVGAANVTAMLRQLDIRDFRVGELQRQLRRLDERLECGQSHAHLP